MGVCSDVMHVERRFCLHRHCICACFSGPRHAEQLCACTSARSPVLVSLPCRVIALAFVHPAQHITSWVIYSTRFVWWFDVLPAGPQALAGCLICRHTFCALGLLGLVCAAFCAQTAQTAPPPLRVYVHTASPVGWRQSLLLVVYPKDFIWHTISCCRPRSFSLCLQTCCGGGGCSSSSGSSSCARHAFLCFCAGGGGCSIAAAAVRAMPYCISVQLSVHTQAVSACVPDGST